MNKLNNFNDFLFNKLMEGLEDGTMSFVLSNRLYKILNEINHSIAHKLLDDDADRKQSKQTLIDIDNDRADMFTFISSPKLIDYYNKEYEIKNDSDLRIVFGRDTYDLVNPDIWKMNRSSMKIGRFINKLYPNEFPINGYMGHDIESFVTEIKSERTKQEGTFKIVKGKDIIKYYNKKQYESGNMGSTLTSSCMAYNSCIPYLEFYAQNENVELILLMSEKEEDKIIGRAILWTIDEIDGEKVENKKFMDRVYYTQISDIRKFKELSKRNNWLYKKDQDMYSDTLICDTKTGDCNKIQLKVKTPPDYFGAYPYMDTLKYYIYEENYLTNFYDDGDYHKLEDTSGGYEDKWGSHYVWSNDDNYHISENDMVWSDEEGRYISADDAVYIHSLSDSVSREYAEENYKWSDKEGDWLSNDDAVHIDGVGYVSNDYAMENYAFCDYDGEYYDYDETYPSEKWGGVPFDKSIKVFINTDFSWQDIEEDGDMFDIGYYADWRYKDDNTYFTIKDKQGNEYHFDKDNISEKGAKKKLKEKEV